MQWKKQKEQKKLEPIVMRDKIGHKWIRDIPMCEYSESLMMLLMAVKSNYAREGQSYEHEPKADSLTMLMTAITTVTV